MEMSKIIIENRSHVTDLEAIVMVTRVMELGLISTGNHGPQYCLCSTSHNERVATF